jgi:hypothetical protein
MKALEFPVGRQRHRLAMYASLGVVGVALPWNLAGVLVAGHVLCCCPLLILSTPSSVMDPPLGWPAGSSGTLPCQGGRAARDSAAPPHLHRRAAAAGGRWTLCSPLVQGVVHVQRFSTQRAFTHAHARSVCCNVTHGDPRPPAPTAFCVRSQSLCFLFEGLLHTNWAVSSRGA